LAKTNSVSVRNKVLESRAPAVTAVLMAMDVDLHRLSDLKPGIAVVGDAAEGRTKLVVVARQTRYSQR
jgi:5-enolpyruvylshikimate-3-phosphate synthase